MEMNSFDIIDFPSELRGIIVKHLDPKSYLTCVHVSKVWNKFFSQLPNWDTFAAKLTKSPQLFYSSPRNSKFKTSNPVVNITRLISHHNGILKTEIKNLDTFNKEGLHNSYNTYESYKTYCLEKMFDSHLKLRRLGYFTWESLEEIASRFKDNKAQEAWVKILLERLDEGDLFVAISIVKEKIIDKQIEPVYQVIFQLCMNGYFNEALQLSDFLKNSKYENELIKIFCQEAVEQRNCEILVQLLKNYPYAWLANPIYLLKVFHFFIKKGQKDIVERFFEEFSKVIVGWSDLNYTLDVVVSIGKIKLAWEIVEGSHAEFKLCILKNTLKYFGYTQEVLKVNVVINKDQNLKKKIMKAKGLFKKDSKKKTIFDEI